MQTFELSLQRRRREWHFPEERFVAYESTDEAWCRPLGIGKEVETVDTLTVPRAYIRSISRDGTMNIGALAEPTVTGVRPAERWQSAGCRERLTSLKPQ